MNVPSESDQAGSTSPTPVLPTGPSLGPRRHWTAAAVGVLVVLLAGVLGWAGFVRLRVPRSLGEISQLLQRQEWVAAENSLRLYLRGHPDDPAALMLLGQCLGGRGALVQAAGVLETVPAGAAERRNALFGAGLAWKDANHRRDAERVWLECLELPRGELEPPDIERQCLLQLCEMYALERRRVELWSMTQRVYDMAEPRQKHQALVMRVRYPLEMVQPPLALGTLQPALDIDPTDLKTRRAIGLYHLEAGQMREARAQLYRYTQEAPDDPLIWEAWCACLHKDQDKFGLERAVAGLPASADALAQCWKFRAIVAQEKSDLEQAVAALERSVQIDPSDPELHHRLGQLLVRMGDSPRAQQHLTRNRELQEARDALRDAMEEYRTSWTRDPARRPELAYQFGLAHEKLGEVEDSKAWYRAALAEDPAHAHSIAALQRLQTAAVAEPTLVP